MQTENHAPMISSVSLGGKTPAPQEVAAPPAPVSFEVDGAGKSTSYLSYNAGLFIVIDLTDLEFASALNKKQTLQSVEVGVNTTLEPRAFNLYNLTRRDSVANGFARDAIAEAIIQLNKTRDAVFVGQPTLEIANAAAEGLKEAVLDRINLDLNYPFATIVKNENGEGNSITNYDTELPGAVKHLYFRDLLNVDSFSRSLIKERSAQLQNWLVISMKPASIYDKMEATEETASQKAIAEIKRVVKTVQGIQATNGTSVTVKYAVKMRTRDIVTVATYLDVLGLLSFDRASQDIGSEGEELTPFVYSQLLEEARKPQTLWLPVAEDIEAMFGTENIVVMNVGITEEVAEAEGEEVGELSDELSDELDEVGSDEDDLELDDDSDDDESDEDEETDEESDEDDGDDELDDDEED